MTVIRYVMVGILVMGTAGVRAQSRDEQVGDRLKAVEATQGEMLRQLKAIQQQLDEIASRLRAAPTPTAAARPTAVPVVVNITGAPTKGSRQAKYVLVEYADFECPFCGSFSRDVLPLLQSTFIDSGELLLAFRHRPLASVHPHAIRAGAAGECAGQQGKFWEMHDLLFGNQRQLDDASLIGRAESLSLDAAVFKTCLDRSGVPRVTQEARLADTMQISSTPTFFFGRLRADGGVDILERIVGLRPAAVFKDLLAGHMSLK